MQPRRHAAGLVADAIESRKKRRQCAKTIAGSVATLASNTIEPSRLLTTQTAVLVVEVSSAAESFMAGRPLRQIRIDPPPCCDNDGECAASRSSPITPPVPESLDRPPSFSRHTQRTAECATYLFRTEAIICGCSFAWEMHPSGISTAHRSCSQTGADVLNRRRVNRIERALHGITDAVRYRSRIAVRRQRPALAEPNAGRRNLKIAAPSHPSVPWFISRPTRIMVGMVGEI